MSRDTHTLPPQPGTIFVGRDRELAVLRAALAAAVGGQGRLVLLAGEPGIGKTRLAEKFARDIATEAAVVRWGRCWEGAGAPALWPWTQLLRAELSSTDARELRARLGAGAEELARLLPELRQRLPNLRATSLADDAGARFRLFDAVAAWLRASAAAQPLVLILEDLQWAERATLELLRFVVSEFHDSHILVVGTYRDTELGEERPLAEVLGTLPYQPLVQRVQLAGLSADEVGALLAALRHERSVGLAERVHRQSGGNPFFATEIALTLDGAEESQIPESVRDAIGHRLQRLSEPCRRVLRTASVLGTEFRMRTLERVVAGTGDNVPVLPALSEATAARILVETDPAAGGYRFAHALIREVLYTGLAPEGRLRLHGQIAVALEALDEAGRAQGASALAHHYAEAIAGYADDAGRRTCVEKAVRYATVAAEQATAMCAYAEAADQHQEALRVLEAWAAHDTARRCDVLLALGEAQLRAGVKYVVRSETFHRAAALARELRDPERLARAALGLAERTATLEAAPDARIALLQEALDAVGPGDSGVRARLLGSLALATYFADLRIDSAQLGRQAVAIARRLRTSHVVVVRSGYHALTEPAQAPERVALATEFLQLGERAGDRETVLYARMYRLYELIAAGQLASAERELAVFSRLADELRQPFFQYRAIAVRAALALLAGRFADAEHLAGEALRLMQSAQEPTVFLTYAEHIGLIYREQGRLDELAGLAGAVDQLPYTPGGRAGLAWIYAAAGRMDQARAEVDRVGVKDLETLPHRWGWFLNLALLAEACAVLADRTRAETLYALLRPYAPHLVFDPSAPICVGSVSLYLGLLADALGRPDDALRHLEEALAIHQRLPSPPWIANTQYRIAAVLLQRDALRDRNRAGELLAEVIESTERLGMRHLQRKALERMSADIAAVPESKFPPLKKGGQGGFLDRPRGEIPLNPPFSKGEEIQATFRKEGDYWLIRYRGPAFRLKDRIGLHYLAVLLREPGREFLATDLVAAVHRTDDESTPGAGGRPALGVSEPYFDVQARHEYARHLRDLQAVVEEAQALHDPERASRARAEIDVLTEELRRGLGIGGRVRQSGSPIERARVALTHAVRATLRAIAECDAELGHYLAATIKTGTYTCYNPDPRHAVAWDL